MKKYKDPLLAQVCRAFALSVCLVGMFFAFSVFVRVPVKGDEYLAGLSGFFFTILVTVILSVFLFGIAQLVSYVGKVAFFTEAIHDSITALQYDSQKRTRHRNPMGVYESGKDDRVDPSVASCPHCGADISVSQIRKGQNTCPECTNVFEAE